MLACLLQSSNRGGPPMQNNSTRRQLLKHTGTVAAGAAAVTTAAAWSRPARAPAAAGANERRVVFGIIGPGGQGTNLLHSFAALPGVEFAWVCDVDEYRMADAFNHLKEAHPNAPAPKQTKDLRKVLDDKSVDAVIIATPDHWHAPMTILACDAGKHVYVEKPASHNLREGRLMIEAARRNKRVVQVGTQSRSVPAVMKAIERIRDGAIGEVLVAKAWNSQLRRNIGNLHPTAPPDGLDYASWLGPVPFVPYQKNFLHSVWRWWHAFGTGDMGNDGVHDIDIARWGLGVTTHPSAITGL